MKNNYNYNPLQLSNVNETDYFIPTGDLTIVIATFSHNKVHFAFIFMYRKIIFFTGHFNIMEYQGTFVQ